MTLQQVFLSLSDLQGLVGNLFFVFVLYRTSRPNFSCQPPSKARARRDRSHVFPVRGDLESARSNEGGVRVKCERQHPAPCS